MEHSTEAVVEHTAAVADGAAEGTGRIAVAVGHIAGVVAVDTVASTGCSRTLQGRGTVAAMEMPSQQVWKTIRSREEPIEILCRSLGNQSTRSDKREQIISHFHRRGICRMMIDQLTEEGTTQADNEDLKTEM